MTRPICLRVMALSAALFGVNCSGAEDDLKSPVTSEYLAALQDDGEPDPPPLEDWLRVVGVVESPTNGQVLLDATAQGLTFQGRHIAPNRVISIQVPALPGSATWVTIATATSSSSPQLPELGDPYYPWSVVALPGWSGAFLPRWAQGNILPFRAIDVNGKKLVTFEQDWQDCDAQMRNQGIGWREAAFLCGNRFSTAAVVSATPTPTDGGLGFTPKYLSHKNAVNGPGSPVETAQYYATTDAAPTLAAFKQRYGFGVPGSDEATATYFNAGDLATGREMHCKSFQEPGMSSPGRVCYVSNYGDGVVSFSGNAHAAVARAVHGAKSGVHQGAFATVTMAYYPPFNAANSVRFAVYGPDGQRVNEAQLDTKGYNKGIPQNCINCHGGGTYNESSNEVLGARFLAFDVDSFVFSSDPAYTLAAQQESFRRLNEHVYHAAPAQATKQLIEGWYAAGNVSTPGTKANTSFVPATFAQTDADRKIYTEVVAPYCRTCHAAQEGNLSLVSSQGFKLLGPSIDLRIFQVGPDPAQNHVMPNAEATLKRFWQSPARAYLAGYLGLKVGSVPPYGVPFSDVDGWKGDPSFWETVEPADVNGDGKLDTCGRGVWGISCALSRGGSLEPARLWISEFTDALGWRSDPSYWQTIQFPDINGDGMADVCGRGEFGIRCAISQGHAFGSATWWSSEFTDALGWNSDPAYWQTIRFPDINGDGMADVCGRGAYGIRCAASNGSSFGPATWWVSDFTDAFGWGSDPSYWQTIRFPDINGDGMADVCGRASWGIACAISNGSSFGPVTDWVQDFTNAFGWNIHPSTWRTIQFPDVSGDGKADICGRASWGIRCAISNGSSFGLATDWALAFTDSQGWNIHPSTWQTIQFPDVNGDGKADVCGRGAARIYCATSNGTSFRPPTSWAQDYTDAEGWSSDASYWQTVRFPDLNGDGRSDICGRASEGMRCALSSGAAFTGVAGSPAFTFSAAGRIPELSCVQILEESDPDSWSGNYFCAQADEGIQWSSSGPIAGMRCTQITEPSDPHAWHDNYLCVPSSSPLHFQWSFAGPIAGKTCVRWHEPADPHTWHDNYLCY